MPRGRLWLVLVGVLGVAALATVTMLLLRDSGDEGAPTPDEGQTSSPTLPQPVPLPVEDLNARARPFDVVLSWSTPSDPSAIIRYEILRDGSSVGSASFQETRFVDEGVEPGHEYIFGVRVLGSGAESDVVSVEVSTPVPPLASARVEGVFDVKSRFTSKTGYGEYTVPGFGWSIEPKCQSGPCAVVLEDLNRKELRLTLKRTKATYKGEFSGKFEIQCGGTPVNSTGSVVLRVAKARAIDGEWLATLLTGTFTHEEVAQLGCRFSRATLSVKVKLFD